MSTIYEFDAEGVDPLPYTWRGKLNLLPHPTAFLQCCVRAADYADIEIRLYADGVLLHSQSVLSKDPFTLPLSGDYELFEIELYGTSRVYSVDVVEDPSEFA